MRILPALAVITIIPLSSTVAVADNFIGNGPPPSPTSPPPPSPTSPPVPSPTSLIRSFVSGKGNDANPCTATSPCQTFQAALAVTAAGGTIYALDSANYGPVTINKAVTITGEGVAAGVLATNGIGITITAGANDAVNLRGLDIDGNNSGTTGIQYTSGKSLTIQKSTLRNFTNSGINFAPSTATSSLFVSDSLITNNANNGILVAPTGSSAVNGALSRVVVSGNGLASNGLGIFVYGGSTTGTINFTIADSVAANNFYGIGVRAASVMVRSSTISNNSVGLRADQGATLRVGLSTVAGNGTGWQATNGGLLQSFANNTVSGNGTDGTLSGTLALQ